MNGPNILLALELARSLGATALHVLTSITNAHAAGRTDLTIEELDAFRDADDTARANLNAKIAAARAAGR